MFLTVSLFFFFQKQQYPEIYIVRVLIFLLLLRNEDHSLPSATPVHQYELSSKDLPFQKNKEGVCSIISDYEKNI